jgi:MFS family permease
MMEPWFDPIRFGAWYGGLGGGLLGGLGGILGALAGTLAPKGKGRSFILGAFTLMTVVGVGHLASGLYALSVGQPYGIWYPLVLIGAILTILFAALRPVVRKRYTEAEARKMAADGFRRA